MKTRIKNVTVLALLNLTVLACTKDVIELPVVPPTPDPDPEPPVPELVYLGVNPTIASMEVVATRGIITQFTDNDRIGLFLTNGELGSNYQDDVNSANIPATYRGGWKVDREISITEPGVAYGYYPYSGKVTDGTAVPVEIASQTDYLYARRATVNQDNPVAEIGMKHALALVSVRIRKNDYQHEGKLTKVEVLDVQHSGTMNIATGKVTGSGSPATYSVEPNLHLDDSELEKTKMIMLPAVVGAASGNMRFQITVDDKIYVWDIPKSHIWEAGKEYTYTLNLGKVPEEHPDLELDVDYWTNYGKDDNIQIEDHTQPGSAYYRVVDVENDDTPYGRTIVSGESYTFRGVVNSRTATWKGRVKYTLWQGDKMVEQFPSYYFECEGKNYFITLKVPCFITAAPGTYRLKMILKEEGKNTWIIPSDRYSEERDWMFTVQADNTIPSIKSMNMEGFSSADNLIRFAKLNKPFNMEYTMTNRANVVLKGEIKAVWHRTFTGEFNANSNDDGFTWEDEIGRANIDLSANTKEYKGMISCQITKERTYPKKYCPQVSFYYKAEGTNIWILMRSDSDSELQRWKGADADKRLESNSEGQQNGWWCEGGFNYQYITLE